MNKTAIISIITLTLMLTMCIFPMIEPEAKAAADPVPTTETGNGFSERELTAQTVKASIDTAAYLQWKAAGSVIEEIPLYFDVAKETFPTMSIAVTSAAVQNLLQMLGLGGTLATESEGNAAVYASNIVTQFNNNMDNVAYGLETQYMYGNLTNAELMNRVYYSAWQLFETQKATGGPYEFDHDKIILDSGVYRDVLHHQHNGLKHFTANLAILESIGSNFALDYENMKINIRRADWNGHVTMASSSLQDTAFTPMIQITNGGYFYTSNNDFYFTGTGGGNQTWQLLDKEGTIVTEITLNFEELEIKHVELNIEPGVYKLARDGGSIDHLNRAYGMVTPTAVSGASVRSVLNLIDLNQNRLLATIPAGADALAKTAYSEYRSGYVYKMDHEASNYMGLSSPSFWVMYTSSAGVEMGIGKIYNNLGGINDLIAQSKTQLNAALSSAQAAYNAAITAGEWLNIVPPPHQLLPNSDRFDNMTTEQWEFVYLSWINGMTEWINSGVIDNISLDNLPASNEALDLVVQADVYKPDGTIMYDDIIFVPYVTKPLTLATGQNSTTDGPTYLIAYGEDGDNISTANPLYGTRWYTIPNGSNISVEAMEWNGTAIDTINLTIKSLYEILVPTSELGSPPPQSMTDLEWFIHNWHYVAMAAGGVLLFAGLWTRQPWIILIGLLLALIGTGQYMTQPEGLLGKALNSITPQWWPW